MVRDLLATRVCPTGQQPSYVDINGTTYVTCVTGNRDNPLALGLGLGLGLGIPVMIVIGYCIWQTWKRRRDYPNEVITESVNVQPVRRRWEDFINEGSYIRRIAQLLDNEETTPLDIQEYFAENFPDVWEKVNQPANQQGYDFVSRSAKLIKVLFDEQARLENKPVIDTINAWEDKLVDKAGGEFGFLIMERVKKMC